MTLNNGIVKPGIDNLIENYLNAILKKKIALVANLASINHKIQSTIDILHNIIGNNLTAIFTPEHGLYGYKEYMVKVKSEFNSKLNIPIYSLYSNNLAPTGKMLKKIDTIIFDLQDIGVRYYTYASTLALCMEKCSILNKELIILDRPNPLSGNIIQGKILEKGYESFVGKLPIPVRHSLTIGELALLIKDYYKFNIELTVIPMQNWKRNMFWKDTDLYWIQPSPNMPHWETTIFYPGACLLEGTNISEGRGTTKPFEILGAPWIDHYELASFINNLKLPYISAIPIYFIPNADLSGKCSHPKYIIFLTADAFGVLPPVALLSVEEAMYHFVSGYTSKLAGTERGIVEPQATFSTCFREPFMPLSPDKYAKLLKEKILKHKSKVYLLNTGWTGGPYGVGKRFNLPYTRRMVKAILTDEFGKIKFEKEEFFR